MKSNMNPTKSSLKQGQSARAAARQPDMDRQARTSPPSAASHPATSKPSESVQPSDSDSSAARLSPHFTLWELTRSGTAIRHGLDNRPPAEAVGRLRALCLAVLEPLRGRVGRVLVTSGYRSRELNQRVGGAIGSQHCLGEAADLYVSSTEQARKYADLIAALTDFDQLILEPRGARRKRWVHVSHTRRRHNRHERLE